MEISNGVAEGACVGDRDQLAGLPLVDVDAEYNLRFVRDADLVARLARGVGGEEKKEPAIEGSGAFFLCKGDGEFRRLRRGDLRGEKGQGEERERDASHDDRDTAHERILHGEKWQQAHE